MSPGAGTRLRIVKSVHTIVWLFFAGCIFAIPVEAWHGRFDRALFLIACVMIEVAILAFNAGRCPLNGMAARYTPDRRANFDIYLPAWLARHTKLIFGALFGLGVVATIILRAIQSA